jgi:hypothetical protein
MAEVPDEEHHEEPEVAADGTEEKGINDPLTRTDVEAPRVPFGSSLSE